MAQAAEKNRGQIRKVMAAGERMLEELGRDAGRVLSGAAAKRRRKPRSARPRVKRATRQRG